MPPAVVTSFFVIESGVRDIRYVTTPVGLRDRALIALMTYTFARVSAGIKMNVEDVYIQGRRT